MQLKQISPKSEIHMAHADLNKNFIVISDNYKDKITYYLFETNKKQFYYGRKTSGFITLNGKKISRDIVLKPKNEIVHNNTQYKVLTGKGILMSNSKESKLVGEKQGLQSSFITGFFISKDNNLYISTLGGGISILENTLSRKIFKINQLKTRDVLYKKPYYYLLSEGVIYKMDRENVLYQHHTIRNALTMYMKDDDVYIGNFEGIYKFKGKNGNLMMTHHEPGTMGVSRMFELNNQIYFSTYGSGIIKLSKGLIERNDKYPFLNFENIFKINNGFAGVSYQSGLLLLDGNLNFKKYYNKKNGLPTNFVTYACEKQDTLWIGMKNNLAYLNNDKLTIFPDNQHLEKDGSVKLIFSDAKNQTWIITEKEFYKISKNLMIRVGTLNILNTHNSKIVRAAYNPENNELMVATSNEFSIVNLNNLITPKKPAKPVIEKVLVDGKEYKWDGGRIRLKNNYKNLKIHFKSIDNDILTRNSFQYSVEGKPWTDFTTDNVFTITNLKSGTYDINFRSINASGSTTEIDKKIDVKIIAPYYFRGWFIISSLLLFMAIAWLVIDSYTSKRYSKKLEAIRIQTEIENERKRISRDLHDNLGAYTTSLISKVDQLRTTGTENESELMDIRENADYIMSLIRQTIWILSSKETTVENYADTFKSYAIKYFGAYSDIKVIFIDDIRKNRILDSALAMSLFRIVQEALQNIMKHSKATEVKITFVSDEKMYMKIEDNGVGFDVNNIKSGFGIKNMKERCREMNVDFKITSDNNGTVKEFREL